MNVRTLNLVAFVTGLFGTSIAAADFVGTEALMCSLGHVIECIVDSECRTVTNSSVDAPDFVKLNFRKKQIVSMTAGKDSPAQDITVTDLTTHLFVQGTQGSGQGDALGYSLSIDKATGQMTGAAAGENAGFIIFGACTPI